jgi:hypothetical protein
VPVPDDIDRLVPTWLTVPDVAERLDIDVRAVRQLLRDRQLLALRRGPNDVLSVPAGMISGGAVVKGLPGTITVLGDSGFDDVQAIRWLHTPDGSLPGTPLQALAENRKTEVRRRAQAMSY